MDLIKKHGEKLLFLVLAVVFAASVLLAMTAKNSLRKTVQHSPNAGTVEINADTEKVQSLIGILEGDVPKLDVVDNAFTPQVRVVCINATCRAWIPKGAKICPYCETEQTEQPVDTDGDGMADQELTWGMDPNDPNDVFLDQDQDGFITKMEVEKGFIPVDAQSHPPLIDYLRLGDVEQSSIYFELKGIAKLGKFHTLQLYWKYPEENRGRTQYIREGNRFGRNNEFKVISYTEKRSLVDGKYLDLSKALISAGGVELELTREGQSRKGKITESSAVIYLIMGKEWEKEVRLNETIELDKKSYIIVDINSQSVVLKPDVGNTDSADAITVRKATQEELDALNPPEPQMNNNFLEEGMPIPFQ